MKSMFKSDREHASNYETDMRKGGSKKKAKHNEKDKDFEFDESFAGIEHSLPQGKSLLHSVKWERIILDEVSWLETWKEILSKLIKLQNYYSIIIY